MINTKKAVPWLLVILWMSFIFFLSHQPVTKSNKLSTGITEKFVEIAGKVDSDKNFNIGRLNHIIRKNAHFFAYLILGVLVLNGLRSSVLKKYTNRFSLVYCIFY